MQIQTHLRCYLLSILLFTQQTIHAEILLNEQFVGNSHGIQLRLLNEVLEDSLHSDQWLFRAQTNIDANDYTLTNEANRYAIGGGLSRPMPEMAKVYDYFVMKKLVDNDGLGLIVNANLQASQYTQFDSSNFLQRKRDDTHWSPSASIAIQLEDDFLLGSEYRKNPNLLDNTRTSSTQDIFITWSPHARFSMTGSYIELNNQVNQAKQASWYLFGQISY
jgi:Protein of unknown function (DUF3034)